MMRPRLIWFCQSIDARTTRRRKLQAQYFTASCGAVRSPQPPNEKCAEKARANPPKPPRLTPLDPESGAPPDDAWLVPVSLEKKFERHEPPVACPPLHDDVRLQSPGCCVTAGAAMPGEGGWQLPRGINA